MNAMDFVAQTLRIAVPYLLAAAGGVLSEKAGLIALTLEGYMLGGAFGAAVGSYAAGAPWVGVLASVVVGGALAMLYASSAIRFKADQVVVGIAINLLAIGLTRFFLRLFFDSSSNSPRVPGFDVKGAGTGFVALAQNPLVWIGLVMIPLVAWLLYRTPYGLRVRAVGEHPAAAASVGVPVTRVRYIAVLLSGMIAGLGGAYLALDQHQFTDGMTAGRGFIALAAIIFGKWNPLWAGLACLLFAAAETLQIQLQGTHAIPSQFVEMIPYLLTIIALAGLVGRAVPPRRSAGRPRNDPRSHRSMKSSKSKLWILMITAFIDMVGLLMVLPLLPFYAKTLGQGGLVVGLLVSSFAVAQLITAPMWGRLSDAYGRRPAMLVGLTASAVAYIIFAFALELPHSLFWLFMCRIVQGAGGGTVSVIQAYVADATAPEERAKALGWLSAATNAGVAIGPVLGSLTHAWGPRGPGLFAAVLCVGNIAFAWKYLDESRDMHEAAESKADTTKRARSRDAVLHVVTHSSEPASRLIWIYAIALGAFQGVTSMLALYLSTRFGVTENSIGFFFAYTGVISVLTRALILGRMVDRYGEVKLSRFGLTLLATGIAAMAFTKPISDPARVAAMLGGLLPAGAVAFLPYLPLALAVALLPLGTAFTFPCVTAMLSRVIPSKERGLYMGVQQTFGGSARVVFPILFGVLFDIAVPLPFLLSASLVVFTIWIGVGMEGYVQPKVVVADPL